MCREKPNVPIIALSPLQPTLRKLCLYWGVHGVQGEVVDRFKRAVIDAARAARDAGFADETKQIVVITGRAVQRRGLDQHPARRFVRRAAAVADRPGMTGPAATRR